MPQLIIAPSIIAADFAKFPDEVAKAETAGADWLHIDVMDGRFVPNITFGPLIVAAIDEVTDLPLDVHLMVEEPERYIDAFIEAGADIVTIHIEATRHIQKALHSIREKGAKAGIALNPGTPPDSITEILSIVDLVLVMSVNPGFGGQKFIESTPYKIRRLKSLLKSYEVTPHVEVDGGIDSATAPVCVTEGADVLVAGTSVFKSNDYSRAIATLRKSAEGII